MALFTLLISCGLASAQDRIIKIDAETPDSVTDLSAAVADTKSTSSELLAAQENEISQATAKLDELRKLVADGLVARIELEAGEQALVALKARLEATQKQIADSDRMIAEIQEKEQLAKAEATTTAQVSLGSTSKPSRKFSVTPTMLRYSGATAWSLQGLPGIQSFFSTTFGRALPTSAVGQSATHNQLGYNHRNAVDVALHPDSSEGKSLINYLKTQGIPFLAFRAAIPGVATGPHIHIGNPSHRLS